MPYRVCRRVSSWFDKLTTNGIRTFNNLPKVKIEYLTPSLITLETFNTLTASSYQNTQELMFNAPSVETEMALRAQLSGNPFNTSAIIVVDEIPTEKISLVLETKTYEDTREKLIHL